MEHVCKYCGKKIEFDPSLGMPPNVCGEEECIKKFRDEEEEKDKTEYININ